MNQSQKMYMRMSQRSDELQSANFYRCQKSTSAEKHRFVSDFAERYRFLNLLNCCQQLSAAERTHWVRSEALNEVIYHDMSDF